MLRCVAAGAVLVAATAAGLALWMQGRADTGVRAAPPTLVSIERDGLRYQYNAISGREALFDVETPAADRCDLGASRPADLLRMRRLLETQLGVPSIDALHEPHRVTADALRSMGYL